ncbi:hypothetical protein CN234_33885 [Sinorhizobium meliloti]|nr:hypothetical protein CN234_33885 [Sinorhizobium meliloti]
MNIRFVRFELDSGFPIVRPRGQPASAPQPAAATFSPQAAGESHLANKRLFCCGKSILGVLR